MTNHTGSMEGINTYIPIIAINNTLGMAIIIIFFNHVLLSLFLRNYMVKIMNQQRMTLYILLRLNILTKDIFNLSVYMKYVLLNSGSKIGNLKVMDTITNPGSKTIRISASGTIAKKMI